MKTLIALVVAAGLVGCSNSQDIGDADKPMPANAATPSAPAAAGGAAGPAAPGQSGTPQ